MKWQQALVITIVWLTACSSVTVTSDWDPDVTFSQFKTFALLDDEPPAVNRFVNQRIKAAIVADLTAKGFRQTDTLEQAGLAIGHYVTTEDRTSYQTVHSGWGSYGFRYSHPRRSGHIGSSTTKQINYTVGTLIIAVFEMNNKELVWEASGSSIVNPSSNPEQSAERINDAVQQILESFPPGT